MLVLLSNERKHIKTVMSHTSGISVGGAGDTNETFDRPRLLMNRSMCVQVEVAVWTQQSSSDGSFL